MSITRSTENHNSCTHSTPCTSCTYMTSLWSQCMHIYNFCVYVCRHTYVCMIYLLHDFVYYVVHNYVVHNIMYVHIHSRITRLISILLLLTLYPFCLQSHKQERTWLTWLSFWVALHWQDFCSGLWAGSSSLLTVPQPSLLRPWRGSKPTQGWIDTLFAHSRVWMLFCLHGKPCVILGLLDESLSACAGLHGIGLCPLEKGGGWLAGL